MTEESMRYLEDLEKIDWRALGDEDLELPELVGAYIESKDGRALDLIFWEHILPDSEYLTQATSYVVEFFIPLLEEEERGDEAAIIWNLAQTCWAAMESRNFHYGPDCDAAEWSFLTLQAVAEGFDGFVRIFDSRPDLRLPIAFILTCFPERASHYLPQIIRLYDACQKQFEKCELLVSLDQAAARISNWYEILLTAIANDGAPVLRHFAACLLVAHHGSDAPRHCLSLLAKASPDEVPPYRFLQTMELPYTEVLGRALRVLAVKDRIPIVVSILARVKQATTAHRLVAYLLEAVSMQPDLRLGRELGSGEFLPLNGATARPLRVDPSAPDWIPAIVHCEPFWKDTIDLLSLFGLPSTRAGLIDLWQSVHEKPFPKSAQV
jgi:hypothetical protein